VTWTFGGTEGQRALSNALIESIVGLRYKDTRVMMSLYRPHVEFCAIALNPHYIKDKKLIERV